MIIFLYIAVSLCVGAGVFLVLSRDAFRIVVGFTVLGSAVNLIVFLCGRPATLIPPIIPRGAEILAENSANPLPQALALTAIVIGFALLCFALVLAAQVSREHGYSDVTRQQAAEPQPLPGNSNLLQPPVMEQD